MVVKRMEEPFCMDEKILSYCRGRIRMGVNCHKYNARDAIHVAPARFSNTAVAGVFARAANRNATAIKMSQ
jgi:hypothetical protein